MRLRALFVFALFSQLVPAVAQTAATPATPAPPAKPAPAPEFKPYDEVLKDTEKQSGLFTIHRTKKGVAFLELNPEQLDRDFICFVTIETGLGERGILSGMPMQEWLCRFRRVNDRIHFVQRNTGFRADPKDPIADAVRRSFSDSILGSFAIETVHPERKSVVVNLNSLLLTDLADLANVLNPALATSFGLDTNKTHLGTTKVFPQNVELQANYVFHAGKASTTEALADPRSLALVVQYSFSELPVNSYRPRLADDRVGYFVTAFKEFSDDNRKTPFVRYVNRWHLEPGPDGRVKQPLVYWLDKATPREYRDAVREGVLFWNKAYERIGLKGAIEVRQMPDDATWDPADVRYNVIRWIASSAPSFGAMGPSRTNPLTGQILDADIIIDAEGTVRSIKHYYRRYINWLGANNQVGLESPTYARNNPRFCAYGTMKAEEAAFGGLALMLADGKVGEVPTEFIAAFLRDLTAHEVGHTLGLRHNFHASTLLPLKDLHNTEITSVRGLAGSVMDYLPINLAPRGVKQGHFFMPTIGQYDEWAIEYGYKPLPGMTTESEVPELKRIATRAPMKELAYATDEDASDFGAPTSVDPLSQRFDMSAEPLAWARQRVQIVRDLLPRVNQRIPVTGESYTDARAAVESLFTAYTQAVTAVSKYVGGIYVNRDFAGDTGGRVPFEPVTAATQREALALLRDQLFAANALPFSPALLNKLQSERQWHWMFDPATLVRRVEYPLLDRLLIVQVGVLGRMYHPFVLHRLRDAELRAEKPGDFLPLPELFATLRDGIWEEVGRASSPTIITARRQLQREHLTMLINLTLRPQPGTPEDARTLAWTDLRVLKGKLAARLKLGKLDPMTTAHLSEALARLSKALEARFQQQG